MATLSRSTAPKRGAHYTGVRPTQQELKNRYASESSGQMARRYRVSKKTMANWLEQAGITRRSAQEAALLRYEASAEFVPLDERDNCLLDRAWEARPERRIKYKDRVVCRLDGCFRLVSRLTGGTMHLAIHHDGMSGEKYGLLLPGHRRDCFQHTADANGLDVEKLMDDWCREWATANELRQWRITPILAQSEKYIGCLLCGRKLFGGAEIQRHLRDVVHEWNGVVIDTLEKYRAIWSDAPYESKERRVEQSEATKRRYHRTRDDLAQARSDAEKATEMVRLLELEVQGQPAVIRARFLEVLPKFELLFSLPVIKANADLLLENRKHPDLSEFSEKEIIAARKALVRGSAAKRPINAACHFIADEKRMSFETIRRYVN